MYVQTATLENLQMTGCTVGYTSKNFAKANKEIAIARNATPEKLRHLFRSYIGHDGRGYIFGWVLK